MFIPTEKPDRAESRRAPDLAAMMKDYKGDAAVAAGEAFDALAGEHRDADDAHASCPTGLKVALLPKETRGGRRDAARLRFGDEESL